MEKCVHILVKGRVQGVFFRASARECALDFGLRGLVRNLRDGRVEIVACGPESALEQFLTWCSQGPPDARVDDVQVEDWTSDCEYDTFRVAR
ncbi:MAG: acylphosphatase [Gammaproteobacteria bacterium]